MMRRCVMLLRRKTCKGATIPLLRQSDAGRIVNVSSEGGSLARMGGGTPAYSVSKAALREELHQRQRQNVWVYIVRLTFQDADLRMRDRFAECLGCFIHECVTCSAIHDECRCGYDGCPFGGY